MDLSEICHAPARGGEWVQDKFREPADCTLFIAHFEFRNLEIGNEQFAMCTVQCFGTFGDDRAVRGGV